MDESAHRFIQASREHVESLAKMSRSMNAQKATRISPSAMAEVQSALNKYWDELDARDLSEASKGIYMANADNFVRWDAKRLYARLAQHSVEIH